ncbi:hypothetical protein EXIGLDRAFT_830546 [Exidia glandulosa HHB12029]|uniref:Uncharacterized protein n=1 Tax=Exidia glandulosa HHB12029 TaxID=1314781 RepID=A0A165NEZ6_EXIGL|nr:hypothetical protein EXIGLDRAFT_830546 [Exidia glandulosa HHB12029]
MDHGRLRPPRFIFRSSCSSSFHLAAAAVAQMHRAMTSPSVRALATAMALAAMAALTGANNVTIDDADSTQWSYLGQWGIINPGSPCQGCALNLDPAKAKDGTWHELSQVGSATLTVKAATAISIFAICPGEFYLLNATFFLDGAPAGSLQVTRDDCPTDTYNYVIFSADNLDLKDHTVQVLNHVLDPKQPTSDLLIDYAIIDDGTPQSATSTASSTGSPTGGTSVGQTQTAGDSKKSSFPVAAVVVPIILVLLLACGVGFWFWRRRRQNGAVGTLEAVPYHEQDVTARPYASTHGGATMASTGPPASSFYGNDNRYVHADDATESTTFFATPAAPHDPQLEAALAIIADRATRSQGSQSGSVVNVSTAQAQARRPEKATYRSQSNASASGPALQRAASTAASSSANSHSRALSTSTVDPVPHHDPAPPSYMDTISPRH